MSILEGQVQIVEKTTSQTTTFGELTIGHLYYTSGENGDVCMRISEGSMNNSFNYESNTLVSHNDSDVVFKSKCRYVKGEW